MGIGGVDGRMGGRMDVMCRSVDAWVDRLVFGCMAGGMVGLING